MKGNADFYSNENTIADLLQQRRARNVYLLNSGMVEVPVPTANHINGPALSVLGYPCVPFTPHRLKDFERFDTRNPNDILSRPGCKTKGFMTWLPDSYDGFSAQQNVLTTHAKHPHYASAGWDVRLPHDDVFAEQYSIESEMERLLDERPTLREERRRRLASEAAAAVDMAEIWMTHSPPFDSPTDLCKTGDHCGSVAIRRLIEREQPLLTLHGHIHETVDKSDGIFMHMIGRTVVACAGNDPRRDTLAALVVTIGGFRSDGSTSPRVVDIKRVQRPLPPPNSEQQIKHRTTDTTDGEGWEEVSAVKKDYHKSNRGRGGWGGRGGRGSSAPSTSNNGSAASNSTVEPSTSSRAVPANRSAAKKSNNPFDLLGNS